MNEPVRQTSSADATLPIKNWMNDQSREWADLVDTEALTILAHQHDEQSRNWIEFLIKQSTFYSAWIPHARAALVVATTTSALDDWLSQRSNQQTNNNRANVITWHKNTKDAADAMKTAFDDEVANYIDREFTPSRLSRIGQSEAINICMREFWRHDLCHNQAGLLVVERGRLRSFVAQRLRNDLADWNHGHTPHVTTQRRVDEAIRRLLRNMGARGRIIRFPPPTKFIVANGFGQSFEVPTLQEAHRVARGGSNVRDDRHLWRIAFVGWSHTQSGYLVTYSGSAGTPGQTFELVGADRNSPDFRQDLEDAAKGTYTLRRRAGKGSGPSKSTSQRGSSVTEQIYVVQRGDSLSKIAQRLYGNGRKWRQIWDANRDKIRNPNLIHPGQEFIIP